MGLIVDRRKMPGLEFGNRFTPSAMSPGIQVLVPGLAQWKWGQRERGLVFLLSFVATLVACVLCWGSLLGWAFLGFAFLTQSAAVLDVVQQRAFPAIHPGIAVGAITLSIGLAIYLPLAGLLWLHAFPVLSSRMPGTGYLVDREAYEGGEPVAGQWVWMRDCSRSVGLAGQVIAIAGQEVEWTGRRWRVDGKDLLFMHPGALPFYPASWRFQVPRDHVLIDQEPSTTPTPIGSVAPLAIVSRDRIVGRAWARYYPFWDRCLL
jgi:hypothetical protein